MKLLPPTPETVEMILGVQARTKEGLAEERDQWMARAEDESFRSGALEAERDDLAAVLAAGRAVLAQHRGTQSQTPRGRLVDDLDAVLSDVAADVPIAVTHGWSIATPAALDHFLDDVLPNMPHGDALARDAHGRAWLIYVADAMPLAASYWMEDEPEAPVVPVDSLPLPLTIVDQPVVARSDAEVGSGGQVVARCAACGEEISDANEGPTGSDGGQWCQACAADGAVESA